jgi:hypothetical protein
MEPLPGLGQTLDHCSFKSFKPAVKLLIKIMDALKGITKRAPPGQLLNKLTRSFQSANEKFAKAVVGSLNALEDILPIRHGDFRGFTGRGGPAIGDQIGDC